MTNNQIPSDNQFMLARLTSLMSSSRPFEVAEELRHVGSSAISLLIAQLGSTDYKVRRWSAYALGILAGPICDQRGFNALLHALSDTHWWVRLESMKALNNFSDEKITEFFITMLDDSNAQVRACAADILGESGDARAILPLITVLADQDEHVRNVAVASLAYFDSQALPTLLKALSETTNPEMVASIVNVLGALGDGQVVNYLIDALRQDRADVRQYATVGLDRLRDKRAVVPLIEALADINGAVRAASARALGAIKDKQAVMPLINALSDPEPDVRANAAQSLGELSDSRALSPLINLLLDTTSVTTNDVSIRVAVAYALGELQDQRAVQPLLRLLGTDDADVRWAAVVALGMIGDKHALSMLKDIAQHDYEEVSWGGAIVAEAAARAIDRINGNKNSTE